jgi:dTDP-4-dehydrorhamnose reductase
MKKILVTGSNGLLGQKLTDLCLIDSEVDLIASSKGPNRHPVKNGYIYEDLDILDYQQLERVIKQYHPDTIINTAAMTNVDTCESDKENCYALNVGSVKSLIHLSEQYNIQLIHLSTDFIFDGESGPYSEDDLPNPLSHYGQTKLEAEQLLRKSSCRWVVLRTIIVYGIVNWHQEKVKPSPTCQLGQGGIRSGEMWRKSQLNERIFRNILSSTSFDAPKGRNHVCISTFIFSWCRFNYHGITDHRFNCLRW